MLSLLDALISVGSELSFYPSLLIVWKRRRHFEIFITIFQFMTSILFTLAKTLNVTIVLDDLHWHLLSDIMTETYVVLICVHLMGIKGEDRMMFLRYLGFGLTIIVKFADGWSSVLYEVLLLVGFALYPIFRMFATMKIICTPNTVPLPYDKRSIKPVIACVIIGLILLRMSNGCRQTFWCEVGMAITRVSFGVGTYYLWKILPCFDHEKDFLGYDYR